MTKKESRIVQREEKKEKQRAAIQEFKKKKQLKWIGYIGVIVATILALVFLAMQGRSTISNTHVDTISEQDTGVKGNPDASLVIIEYSDFQCPACKRYKPILTELAKEFPEDIAIVYRHSPLTSIHANAKEAAEVSEAAALQGKFWEMHDLLFDRQSEWSELPDPTDTFLSYAQLLELDTDKFTTDLNSDTVKNKVASDAASAKKASVSSTPSFFINGERIDNPSSLYAFRNIIKKQLNPAS